MLSERDEAGPEWRWDYLVGAPRISLESGTTTPAPRAHVLGMTGALRSLGDKVDLYLASQTPGLRRVSRAGEGSTQSLSRTRLILLDVVRLVMALWSGIYLFLRTLTSRPHVIYERVSVLQSFASFHARKRTAVRVVEANGIMTHETAGERNALASTRISALIEKHVYRKADVIVAVSDALAQAVSEFSGVPSGKIVTIANGIPEIASDLAVRSADGPVIGFVGNVVRWQGLDDLLSAVASLRDRDIGIEIVGDGPETSRLAAQAAQLGIANRVVFTGRLSHEAALHRMGSWWCAYSGHVATSKTAMYHSPLKLYEYVGRGLPVLCTDSADARALRASGASIQSFHDLHGLREAIRCLPSPSQETEEIRAMRLQKVSAEHGWQSRARLLGERVAVAMASRGLDVAASNGS